MEACSRQHRDETSPLAAPSMKKKSPFLIAAALVLLAGILYALNLSNDGPGVTKANFDRVEEGMTLEEVEAIFGKSGFCLGGGGTLHTWVGFYTFSGADGAVARITVMRSGLVEAKNAVTDKSWTPSTKTLPAKLRRWLHLF